MTRAELLKIAKPILFNTEMVKAILEGRKTVTRRVCKDGNDYTVPDMGFYDADKRTYAVHNYADAEHTDKLSIAERKCPICPGDILYVRETWGCYQETWADASYFLYRADYPEGATTYLYSDGEHVCDLPKWKPSIHMPKEAARIFLKVTDVRVERLQDITEEQALAEGVPDDWPMNEVYCPKCHGKGLVGTVGPSLGFMEVDCRYCEKATNRFSNLWNSTIKREDIETYGWDANPFVWVIEFERIEPDCEV